MDFFNNITKRHMIFGILGTIFGFVLEGSFGAILGMALGISIAEITHMIDSARK